jgi:hypothetical protein
MDSHELPQVRRSAANFQQASGNLGGNALAL